MLSVVWLLQPVRWHMVEKKRQQQADRMNATNGQIVTVSANLRSWESSWIRFSPAKNTFP